MMTYNNVFEHKLSKLSILVALSTLMVGLSPLKTMAIPIPIDTIIYKAGNRVINSILGIDSNNQQTPPNQTPPYQSNGSQSIPPSPTISPNPTTGYSVPSYPNTSSYPELTPSSTSPANSPVRSSPTIIINNY